MRRRLLGLAAINSEIWPCRTSAGEFAPVEASANRSCTSLARTVLPLILYLEPLDFSMTRMISSVSVSLKAAGAIRALLSTVRVTWAWFRPGRVFVPLKMTSSMAEPRMALAELAPITQRIASRRLDLPQPLGPTIPVKPGSIRNSVGSTKDLKPVSLIELKTSEPITYSASAFSGTGSPVIIASSASKSFLSALTPFMKIDGVPRTPWSMPSWVKAS